MKRILFAALLLAGMSRMAFADSIPQVVSTTTNSVWTRTVYNDSGASITSGTVVIWDNDDTEFDRSGYPYIDVTTAPDSAWVAGVMLTGDCPDQSLCEIVVRGVTPTRMADSTDASAEDTLVSTSTVSGQAGDYGPAVNTCALGMLTEDQGTDSENNELDNVFVNVNCQ